MASISSPNVFDAYSAKSIFRIVGFTCLVGFLFDVLALGLPPNPMALEWRLSFLEQVGNRSVILLFGAALTMFGIMDGRRLLRQLAILCLVVGVIFHLSCVLMIRDTLTLQQQTLQNISSQAAQLQTQIQQAQDSPELPENITPEQIQQASQSVSQQAESLKQNARTGITKAGIASLGNFVVVGLGLISLGRFGLRKA